MCSQTIYKIACILEGFLKRCLLTSFLLFWHAPLVRSAKRRHQPPQRAVLSQIDWFIQRKVVGSQVSLDGVQPRDTGMLWWSLPVLWRGAVRINLASASSSIRAMCPSMDRRRDWIITVRLGIMLASN